MSTYIDAKTLDQCREALRQGGRIEFLAGQLQIEPHELANLLGLPQWRTVPTDSDVQDGDLWAVDRLGEMR